MKKLNLFLLSLLLILVLSSCSEEQVPDPSGTITATVNFTKDGNPINLYRGKAEDAQPNQYQYVAINFGMNSSLNTSSVAVVLKDASFTDYSVIFNLGCEFSDIGEANGLGAVTTIPNDGWAESLAIQVGHGYVIRYRHSFSYTTSTLPYFYYRFYVVKWLESTSGGIIGATLKYATLK